MIDSLFGWFRRYAGPDMSPPEIDEAASLWGMGIEMGHIFVYGEIACPVNDRIGPWRCIACGVIETRATGLGAPRQVPESQTT